MKVHIQRALHSGNQLRSEMHMQRAAFLNTQNSLKYGASSDDEDFERPKKRKRLVKTSEVKTSASQLQSDIESEGKYKSDGKACKECGRTDLTEEDECRICCEPRKVRIKLENHQEKIESLQELRRIFKRVKFKRTDGGKSAFSENDQLRFKFEHGDMVAKEPIYNFRKGRHGEQGFLAATLLKGMDASFTASIKKHIPLFEHIAGKLIRRSQRFAEENFPERKLELLNKWDIQLVILTPLVDYDLKKHTDHYGCPFYWTVSMGPKGTTKFQKGTEVSGPHEEKDAVYAWNGSHRHWAMGKKSKADVRMFLVVKPTRIKDSNDGHTKFMSWEYIAKTKKFTTPVISFVNRPRGIAFKKSS